jgi:putative transposase
LRPAREPATHNQQTYFVSSQTWGRRNLFAKDRWAKLLVDCLYHYRGKAYLLHEFVVMPDHFHVLITPIGSLEKAVQFIKGGFSYRAKKELQSNKEVWQTGFSDHRIRDLRDYQEHVEYAHWNPVRKKLCEHPQDYPYSSAHSGFQLDPVPQGLKPNSIGESFGAAEAAPLQSIASVAGTAEAAPLRNIAADQQIPRPKKRARNDNSLSGPPQVKKASGGAS